VNLKLRSKHLVFFLLFSCVTFAQDVSLYEQFNGRFDFIFIGNTMNNSENNLNTLCNITGTSSSATLNLSPNDEIQKAYLYWAGSGTGDFEVNLNGNIVNAQRDFPIVVNNLPYFCAFSDVTDLLLASGNGNYTLSDLDVTPFLNPNAYCNNRTNFAGWAIVIVYKNNNLPLNQLNIYDGLQGVSQQQQNLTLNLNSLNVIDNIGAKVGFVAWEGDKNLAVNETLRFNGNILSNALNPANNAFNGTNSFTGSTTLYNMDLDVYDIQNYLQIGVPTAEIKLTSGQDVVLISTVVTKLNSQLPDATISIDNFSLECNSREILVDYTIYNLNSTNPLPAGTPIAIYTDGQLIETAETSVILPLGASISDSILLTIPDLIPNDFTLEFVVDDIGDGTGIVTEINENNNNFAVQVSLINAPEFNILENLTSCNLGLKKGIFDFSAYEEMVKVNPDDVVHFFENNSDANSNINQILNPQNYAAETTPKEIFVRVEDENCFTITSFLLDTKNCLPKPYNAVSANNDGLNDFLFFEGLRDIFMNFKLQIYSRWGRLVWEGDNNSENWFGQSSKGIEINVGDVPDGTYFYILDLNDADYPNPLTGYVYLTR